MSNIVVIGLGAIGSAILEVASKRYPQVMIHGVSRRPQDPPSSNVSYHHLSTFDELSIHHVAERIALSGPIDAVFVTTGALHDDEMQPEKSYRDCSAEQSLHCFELNTIIPMIVAKCFLPHFLKTKRCYFAALSARVGSISDNRLGGWYSYRASKAALNMMIKSLAIEMRRTHPETILVGLHPGTVDSPLSKPFQSRIPPEQLFRPEYAARSLLSVVEQLSVEDSGKCFAWDGQEVLP